MAYAKGTLAERFFRKVERNGEGCWSWKGSKTYGGYGTFWLGKNNIPKRTTAQRFALYLSGVAVPADREVDHLCRNPGCVNPAHLQVVLQSVNLARGNSISVRNAAKTHCVHGHAFSEKNTRVTPHGARACRECHRLNELGLRRLDSGVHRHDYTG